MPVPVATARKVQMIVHGRELKLGPHLFVGVLACEGSNSAPALTSFALEQRTWDAVHDQAVTHGLASAGAATAGIAVPSEGPHQGAGAQLSEHGGSLEEPLSTGEGLHA